MISRTAQTAPVATTHWSPVKPMAFLIAGTVAIPLLVIFSSWGHGEWEVWDHLAETILGDLLLNTLILTTGVGAGVLILGVGLAWLTVMCEFPGRRFFDWALMLPLAIPPYVLAFAALGLLDFSGPVQRALSALFGPRGYWFPEVRSAGGVVAVLTLVLYPYVYMLARGAFLTQGRKVIDAARILGRTPWGAFRSAALPMARPAIAAGCALALMETLADFGAVSIFNFDTFTTAIYKAWFGLFNLTAAAQLSSLLLLFVATALVMERRMRGRARYVSHDAMGEQERFTLSPVRRWLAALGVGTVFALAFAIPVAQLLFWVWEAALDDMTGRFFELLGRTLTLGVLASLLTVSIALFLAIVKKNRPDPSILASVRLAGLGYALPGSVLAVGVMISFTWIDGQLAPLFESLLGAPPTLLLSGSVGALVLAYLVRFLAVAMGPVESGLERIRPSIFEAAQSLGARPLEIVRRIHLPMLRPGLLTALLLTLVEVMKEMPATLLLRPFGWDTLAVRIFEMTSEGEWERAALPAVALVLAGLFPVILLVRGGRRG